MRPALEARPAVLPCLRRPFNLGALHTRLDPSPTYAMFAKFATLLPLVALASCASVPPSFNPSEHLGNLSPYFPAPVPPGMTATLPADCTVDQVMLVRLQLITPYPVPAFRPLRVPILQPGLRARTPLYRLTSGS